LFFKCNGSSQTLYNRSKPKCAQHAIKAERHPTNALACNCCGKHSSLNHTQQHNKMQPASRLSPFTHRYTTRTTQGNPQGETNSQPQPTETESRPNKEKQKHYARKRTVHATWNQKPRRPQQFTRNTHNMQPTRTAPGLGPCRPGMRFRSTCGERSRDRTHRTRPSRSTSPGTWTTMTGSSRQSIPSTSAQVVQPP